MHRQEICRATGRQFVQTAEHDGRLMALIMRDLPDRLNAMLGGRTVLYELSGGPAGGSYRYGPAGEPAATLEMDLPDFNWLASERTTAAEAQAAVRIAGDEALAQQVLAETVDVS